MSSENSMSICFYCGGLVTKNLRGDHFPIPESCGGVLTVPCCISCHDMKDRYGLESWPTDWVSYVITDMPKMSRETRLFLAKALKMCAESIDRRKK